jgi:hypothetical protein
MHAGRTMIAVGSPSTPATRPRRSMPGRRAGIRPGGAGEGSRGLQPVEPGLGADLRRRHRRRQAAAARSPALDRGGLDLQGRDLSLPAARRGRPTRRRRRARRMPAGMVHLPSWIDSEWVKQLVAEQLVTVKNEARLRRSSNGRSSASATRRWTAGSMPAPPPGSPGADRWPDEKWRDLEDQLGAAPTDTDPAGQINRPGQAPQGKRRSDWLGRRGGWF